MRLRFFSLCVLCVTVLLTSSGAELRTWTDATGKFSIEAKFLQLDGDYVVLERASGDKQRIPLSKLSAADQAYVKSSMSKSDENPFEAMTPEPSNAPRSSASPRPKTPAGPPREISVDFKQAKDVVEFEPGREWKLALNPVPPPAFNIRTMQLPPVRDGETASGLIVNERSRRAAMTYQNKSRGGQGTTRIPLMNLETGDLIGIFEGPGTWAARTIHDDGEQIVVANLNGKGQGGTIRITSTEAAAVNLWSPFATRKGTDDERNWKYSAFGNDNKLVTICQGGDGCVWDFENFKPLYRFKVGTDCWPSMSHDRKFLALCGNQFFGLMPLDSRAQPLARQAPGLQTGVRTGLSPSGQRFAAVTGSKVMVWDLNQGEVLFDGEVNEARTGNFCFVDDNFILIANELLFEFETGIKVWKYSGISGIENCMGKNLIASVDKRGGKLFLADLPDDDVLKALARAKQQPDLFILRAGAEIDVDVSNVPSQYQGEVRASLDEQVQRIQCRVRPGAPLKLIAKISGPKSETVHYFGAGEHQVNEYKSGMEIVFEGKTIWQRWSSNIPYVVYSNGNKSLAQQLAEAGSRPDLAMYSKMNLPKSLQKPSKDGQTLGASSVR